MLDFSLKQIQGKQMINCDSHIILYAKLHYQRSDNIMEDLIHLVKQRNGGGIIKPHHVVDTLLFIYHQCDTIVGLLNHRTFASMLWKLNPRDNLFPKVDERPFETRLADIILSELACMPVRDDQGNVVIKLDPPDPNILPLAKK